MQKILLTCCLTGSAILPAYAQTASPEKPAIKPATTAKPKEAVVPEVTVSAERPTNRIDRQVYDVKSDVSSTNGTAADALNNVPSVNVDPDGSVTLRGSANVQIMVDGKPSAMLQGDNRGPALQAMAADDIESIEVINNPGAQFGNEAGGGPILNLVMRRNRKPGGFTTVNANTGTAGRYNSAVNTTYNEGAWGFQGSANVRHDGRNSVAEVSRDRYDAGTGEFVHSSQQSVGKGLNDMAGLNGQVSYNLSQTDTLTGSVNYNSRTNDQRSSDHYLNGATSLTPASDYVRSTTRNGDSKNFAWGGRYDHKGELPGETLKIDLRVSASENDNVNQYTNDYATPGMADTRASQHNDFSTRIVDFTGDYERPLWGGTMKAGYKIATNDSSFNTLYTDIDPVTGTATVNNGRTNAYELDETVYALYGSYQMRLNERWGALAGLRAEYTDMDINQITGGVKASNNYINYIPSFFATYKATDTANIRFAYARRIRRPNANDLNPYVTYRDEFNVSSGNPNLKPTKTDSFEVGYETKFGGLETNLRGYYRRDTDAIVDYRYFVAPNVLLTTKANGEGSHSSGMEFTVSGKLTPSLTLNTSGNLMRAQQSFYDDTGVLVTRTANSLSGRARLNYQYDAANQIQLALQMMGKTLSGQGYRSPNHSINLSLRHTVTPALTLVANVTDIFSTNKMETVINSATLRETSTRRFDGRVVYVGLSYRFGGPSSSSDKEEGGWGGPRPGGPGGPPGAGFGGPPPGA
ncbi:Outer membrane receptor proteins, mostly Fe transport [Duganella sp. CF402]|uniref:TonB-dependent receptor domain-containing protein n=1 Tax=unclassified Duganella TaxID=2636909 RepID=UPI0008D29D9A|nr:MULTISPECIES: TonB-dependent receptor [unclassified Duganella]RZT10634.1 outer membrane receptor protein involved in Fe transport [Duganella sp. BK701]SEL04962.1 Outer membrane receptor proteins, mostly Fe transport [Duganella sp. CF402]